MDRRTIEPEAGRVPSLHPFCVWLQGTQASVTVQSVGWIVPTAQTIHILSIAAVMSAVLMIDLRLIGMLGADQSIARVSRRYGPVIWWALPILLATGVIQIIGEPSRSLENPVFRLKMALLAAALLVTLSHQIPLRTNPSYWDPRRRLARLAGVLSLPLWIAIVFAGRWIAYTG
jgi:hypothetical protein